MCEIKLYLTQLKYIMWVKCTNSAEVKSIRIVVPAVSDNYGEVTVIRISEVLWVRAGWNRIPNSDAEMSGKTVWKCQSVAVCF